MIRFYFGKVVNRVRIILERITGIVKLNLLLVYERNEAHRKRRQVIKRKGISIVNRQVKKSIKRYARQRFGNSAYWPYLALYSEIRGKFIKGWIPNDYYWLVLLPRINPKNYGYISDQKTFDYKVFGDFAVKPLFYFISGMFLNHELNCIDKHQVIDMLLDYNKTIVVKEESGVGGEQVSIIHSSDLIMEDFNQSKNYVIQPYIEQYKILSDLYPNSVNTFRVTTYLKTDGSIHVKFVILRFGVNNSRVDNLSSGGQYLFFDSSGRPSNMVYDYKLGHEIGESHINTGYIFSNIKIPMFSEMLEKCKSAHKVYPYVRLIGWDVCITRSGEPKLIEWNAFNPVFWPVEARFGPFWIEDDEF